ncbi:MAG: gluconokinase [Sphingobium sp.]
MGVSGSGKTTLGKALAGRRQCAFRDADDFHSAANVTKMRSGIPLTDDDRMPWLDRIGAWIATQAALGDESVLACSALKRCYRDHLRKSGADVLFVVIDAKRSLLARRLGGRQGHFMAQALLDSQIADYERPMPDECAIFVSATDPVDRQVEAIVATMTLTAAGGAII